MSDNKYKLFRNYMANELGIGKDDIKEWAMQAVTETVEKHLRGLDLTEVVRKRASNLLVDEFKYSSDREKLILKAMSAVISEKLIIDVSLKEVQNK
jgi:hypothetical protein